MSTFKHRKSVKKARWSKKIRQKQLFFNIFLNQSPKCAIFSKENMILIKDRHGRGGLYALLCFRENMILIKDRHTGLPSAPITCCPWKI